MTWREKRKGRREREGEREGKKGRESNFGTYDPLHKLFLKQYPLVAYCGTHTYVHVQVSACSILVTEIKGIKLWHK